MTKELEILGQKWNHGKVVGWRATQDGMLAMGGELTTAIQDDIYPRVDLRRVPDDETVIGYIEWDDENGEVVDWEVDDQYLKEGEK